MNKKNKKTLSKIEKGIRAALKDKMDNYKRETSYMPFQEAILGKTNSFIYSFSISISTWLGQNSKGEKMKSFKCPECGATEKSSHLCVSTD